MYPKIKRGHLQLSGVKSYQADPLEDILRRATETNEPLPAVTNPIYTNKADGVLPAYDIRTDRFDVAQSAMEKIGALEASRALRGGAAKTEDAPEPTGAGASDVGQ